MGDVRDWVARNGNRPAQASVPKMLAEQKRLEIENSDPLKQFAQRVVLGKLKLYVRLEEIKARRQRVYGGDTPSRGTSLIVYTGMDSGIIGACLRLPAPKRSGDTCPVAPTSQ